MTREETIEAIKVMQAWVDGEKIQYRYDDNDRWYDLYSSEVTWDFEEGYFRIKPKPLEVWHWVYGSEVFLDYSFGNKLDCESSGKVLPGKAVRVRFVAQED